MKILVAGAGIAGLAMALSLRRKHIQCDIVERKSAIDGGGAGMYLPGNSVRALGQLGVIARVRETAAPVGTQRIFNHSGKLLNELDLQTFWQTCGGCLSLSRAALQDILKGELGAHDIRFDTSVLDIQPDGPLQHVTFSDGTSRGYDLVIGADGIQSSIRDITFGRHEPRDLGIACWRLIVDDSFGIQGWTAMLGRKRTLLAIPIEDRKLYIYADVATREGAGAGQAGIHILKDLFSSFSAPLGRVVESLDDSLPVHPGRLREVAAQLWHKNNVVLIGDAAHASSPSMAQGAGQAVEDALVLAEALSDEGSVPAALQAFSARRIERVRWVQKQSRARDKVRTLPGSMRDILLGHLGSALYRKSFTPLLDVI